MSTAQGVYKVIQGNNHYNDMLQCEAKKYISINIYLHTNYTSIYFLTHTHMHARMHAHTHTQTPGEVGQTSKAGQFWRLYHSMCNHTNYTSTILIIYNTSNRN